MKTQKKELNLKCKDCNKSLEDCTCIEDTIDIKPKYPIIIIRNDDNEIFVYLEKGMYRTLWGVLNNSISRTPFQAFNETQFTFYYG
jgi:hypothetical protein